MNMKKTVVPLGPDVKEELSEVIKLTIRQIKEHFGKTPKQRQVEQGDIAMTLKAFQGCASMVAAINQHEQNRILLAFRLGGKGPEAKRNLMKLIPEVIGEP